MENFFSNIHTLSTNSKNHQTISNTNSTDDGLFLGTDALSDFISNCGAITDLFEDLPDLEDLMSLVTFESSSSSSAALSSSGLLIIIIDFERTYVHMDVFTFTVIYVYLHYPFIYECLLLNLLQYRSRGRSLKYILLRFYIILIKTSYKT